MLVVASKLFILILFLNMMRNHADEYKAILNGFAFVWQGIHLRVVGVCDSKSLVVASDVFGMELGDEILLRVCRVKLDGSSLLTLSGSGILPFSFVVVMGRNSMFVCSCLFSFYSKVNSNYLRIRRLRKEL